MREYFFNKFFFHFNKCPPCSMRAIVDYLPNGKQNWRNAYVGLGMLRCIANLCLDKSLGFSSAKHCNSKSECEAHNDSHSEREAHNASWGINGATRVCCLDRSKTPKSKRKSVSSPDSTRRRHTFVSNWGNPPAVAFWLSSTPQKGNPPRHTPKSHCLCFFPASAFWRRLTRRGRSSKDALEIPSQPPTCPTLGMIAIHFIFCSLRKKIRTKTKPPRQK